ncbi:MAG TPA: DUF5325 family protein [Bacillales bacterium]|nr:DUF5325 family protein [Bacillales bacterium]
MPWKNFISFVLAMLTFGCLFSIGGAIAEHSTIGAILSVLGVIVFMVAGFTFKRKFRPTER